MSSVAKFINFNFQSTLSQQNIGSYYDNNFLKKNETTYVSDNSNRIANLIKNTNMSPSSYSLNKFISYPNSLSLINDDSDKKKTSYPAHKLFNSKLNQNDFNNFTNLNKLTGMNEVSVVDNNNELVNSFFNEQITYKNLTMFSPNQSIALPDRYIRNFIQNNPSHSHFNYSLNLNTLNEYLNRSNSNLNFSNYSLLNLTNNF
jgi:hypothetical protein